jgi:pilus assembly protein CpaC
MIVTPHLVQPLAADAQLPSLPGEKLRNYDPNWYRLFFLENGNFENAAGCPNEPEPEPDLPRDHP